MTGTGNLPNWHEHVHLFDGLEISPCVTVGDSSMGPLIEVCDDPAEAEFWSVYGHYNPALCDGFGGVDCLDDFATEAEANAFAAELRRTYPHLREDQPHERPQNRLRSRLPRLPTSAAAPHRCHLHCRGDHRRQRHVRRP